MTYRQIPHRSVMVFPRLRLFGQFSMFRKLIPSKVPFCTFLKDLWRVRYNIVMEIDLAIIGPKGQFWLTAGI